MLRSPYLTLPPLSGALFSPVYARSSPSNDGSKTTLPTTICFPGCSFCVSTFTAIAGSFVETPKTVTGSANEDLKVNSPLVVRPGNEAGTSRTAMCSICVSESLDLPWCRLPDRLT